MDKQPAINRWWTFIPVIGSLLFVILYGIATLYYPGGNYLDHNAIGFSWMHNYWCNLLNQYALNGQPNTARPIAFAAMAILCTTVACFWWLFPSMMEIKGLRRNFIRTAGVLCMLISVFIFTGYHDLVINAAGIFGLAAMAGTLAGLLKGGMKKLFWFGIANLLLVGLNNILYYNKDLIYYLPIVQKISFASFLIWIITISLSPGKLNRYKK